ncbi:hypothetical protein [Lentzea albidocapillata]|uniref:Uncharacterized protein n=1 Tax=Lentzea albidocapillata TaxID=40571 RepID=A0A1W1ZX63_9PSEU|nr:hypothetical protein [Lentzea albidocapillata]SMC52963.1 hypothetical protein SAMN05660733_00286 [Lentzea albidocapillata]
MEAEDIEPPLTGGERAELAWLRKENDFLRVQRDILMNVATGYAHDFEAVLRRDDGRHHH